MLNLVTYAKEYDSGLLKASYEAIRNKQHLEFIEDDVEKKAIYNRTISVLTVPAQAIFSIQNLFKLTLANGQFYIAQCLCDFGYPVSRKLVQSHVPKYSFQLIGISNLKIDLGKTLLRRETRIDKVIGGVFGNDIDFDGTEKFNDKYYLVSNKKEVVLELFDETFVNTIAKYDNIVIATKNKDIFISFDTGMEESHSRILEDIFANCNFLAE